jgi:hypothetical protein
MVFQRLLFLGFCLGFILLTASMISGGFISRGELIEHGEYDCYCVKGSGPIYVDVQGLDNRNFSMYVVDADNLFLVLEEASLENASILLSMVNQAQFRGNIYLPQRGYYGVILTPASGAAVNMRYDILIQRSTPHLPLLFSASFLLIISAVGLASSCLSKNESRNLMIPDKERMN